MTTTESAWVAPDFLVVSAGAAGCVLARRLAERTGAAVVLLEAGGEPDADAAPDGWRLGKPVRLRSDRPGDPPRITLSTLTEPTDLDRLADADRHAVEIANRPEVRSFCSEPAPVLPADRAAMEQRIVDNAYSVPHVVGTCRMGPSPELGDVVDHLGRVHGVEALHVIDASIIPDPPSGFPHVITIMAAEHLAARLSP